ncbi:MAG: hypothetical protein QOH63_1977 [Acidobacteriota bacterium]|jgi:hypothetical protein|nr:hypothetical protein [Acidobacteriota bacterium]
MAVEGAQPLNWSFVPGGVIRQYRYVKLSAANTIVECSAVTDKAIGVSQDPATGAGAPAGLNVCIVGITKLEGDADLAPGDSIGTSNDGQAAAYTAADTTKYINGQVLIDNTAAGGLITAAINCASQRTLA